jgi:rhomboid protease GluP
MTLQFLIVLGIQAISAVSFVVLMIYRPVGEFSWAVVHAFMVCLSAVALHWEWSAPLVLAFYVPLVVLPTLLSETSQSFANQGRTREAQRYLQLAAAFHPTPRVRFNAALARATAHDDAETVLVELGHLFDHASPTQRHMIEALGLAAQHRWAEAAALLTAHPKAATALRPLHLRALGELGRIDEMVRLYGEVRTTMLGADSSNSLLFVAAFAGRHGVIDHLFRTELADLDAQSQSYWRTIAAQSSSAPDETRAVTLAALASTARDAKIRRAATHRLAHPPTTAVVSPVSAALLDAIEHRFAREDIFRSIGLEQTVMTLVLIGVNLLVFAGVAALGNPNDPVHLLAMGAAHPRLVFESAQWWRVGSAIGLHLGWLHLIYNMTILFFIGRIVEVSWGSARSLATYILAGMASLTCVLVLMQAGVLPAAVLMGASGAIYGLIGLETARRLRNWNATRTTADFMQVFALASVLALGALIDLSVPQISFTAHISGLIAGLVCGFVVSPVRGLSLPVKRD